MHFDDEEEEEKTRSKRVYFICFSLILCAVIQDASVKTSYNVPYGVVQGTFNATFCAATGKCDGDEGKLWSTLFWVSMAASEALGMIPAAITGRNLAEILGRTNHLTLCLIPLILGLSLQMVSWKFKLVYLLPIGRLIHSFGTNWSLITSALLSYELLFPDVSPIHISLSIMLLTAICMPLTQLIGISFALGTEDLWGGILILPGIAVVGFVLLLCVIYDPPRYLHTQRKLTSRQRSLQFYKGEAVVDTSVRQKARDVSDWDQDRYFKVMKFIKRQQPEQMAAIRTVIIAEVALTMVMSNVLYLFSTFSLGKGTIRKLRHRLKHNLSKFSSKKEVKAGFCPLHRDPALSAGSLCSGQKPTFTSFFDENLDRLCFKR